ncbi:PH domain-containing protein [Paenibacillus sp. IB182496]|uniref:PH domain-containing protein n=1 Tax=Paenibacillus sabuli TaxID=2772509 RepID=A0A927GUQ4_9BACL|nr:PH domain-containing protein [Paenibacillus sabuli]MBD2847952.1 PH domain-containing protein [Paenibacillus sabuli]
MDKTSHARRMHPLSVVFFIGKAIKDLLYPLLVFVVSTLLRGEVSLKWIIGGGGGLAALLLVVAWLQWYRFVYVPTTGGLRVEQGVFVRKKLWLTMDRVQSVDDSAGVLHRLFGLVKLQVETAGGKKPEIELSGITLAAAAEIRDALGLTASSNEADSAPAADEQPELDAAARSDTDASPDRAAASLRLSLPQLLLYSATSGRIGVVLALLGAAYSQLDDWLEQTFDVWDTILLLGSAAGWTWLGLMLLAAAWLLAAAGTIIRDYGFTIELRDERLTIRRGLLERKQVTVPLQRIQAVHLVDNLLRRPLGLVTVQVVTAGYSGKEGQAAMLFPLVKESELARFLQQFAPAYRLPQQWNPLPRRALRSYVAVPTAAASLAAAAIIIWAPAPYSWLSAILPLLTLLEGWMRYRLGAWTVVDDAQQLALRYGSLSRHRVLVPRRRVQWHRLSQTPLQEGRSLATVHVAVASGMLPAVFHIRHLGVDHGAQVRGWLAYRSGGADSDGNA